MYKIIVSSFIFCVILFATTNLFGQKKNSSDVSKASVEKNLLLKQDREIAEQVRRAFLEVRRKSRSPRLEKLSELGEKVIPYLKPYLNDANLDVRTEAVDLALEIGGDQALDLVGFALHSSKLYLQKNTVDSLYNYYIKSIKQSRIKFPPTNSSDSQPDSFSAEKIAANPQIGTALKQILVSKKPSVPAVFLAANFPDREIEATLKKLSAKTDFQTDKEIPADIRDISLAAEIALAKRGNKDAFQNLLKIADGENIENLKFLLLNINEIESLEIIQKLSKTLEIRTYIEKQMTPAEFAKKHHLPKGFYVETLPPRRFCDLAVNSFVERLGLKISFDLNSTNYFDDNVAEVRELVKLSLDKK